MNSSRQAAETLRKLISFVWILGLLSPVTSAQAGAKQEAGAQEQPAAETPSGGTPFPSDLNIVQLIQDLALQQWLESRVQQVPKEYVLDPAVARAHGRMNEEPIWMDPNKHEIGLPQLEALILIQFVTLARIDQGLQSPVLSREQKDQLITQLRAQAVNVGDTYKRYRDLELQVQEENLRLGTTGFPQLASSAKYAQIESRIAALEDQVSKGINVATNTEEIAQLKIGLENNLYKQFLDAKAMYYEELSAANPLLSTVVNGKPFWTVLLDNNLDSNSLVKALNEYNAALKDGLETQRPRIAGLKTGREL